MNYTLFETTLGTCALVWGDRGLLGVHLPDRHPAGTRASVARRFPGAVPAEPPPDVRQAIDGIVEAGDPPGA